MEYVPAGTQFVFELGGDNLSEDDIASLIALLESVSQPDAPVTIGGMASSGWGRVSWAMDSLHCLTKAELPAWAGNLKEMEKGLPQASSTLLGRIRSAVKEKASCTTAQSNLRFEIKLHITSPWLVRDAQQSERLQKAKDDGQPVEKRPPAATPCRDEKGRPCIPAKEMRGILRARGEAICRTIGEEVPAPAAIRPIGTELGQAEALSLVAGKDYVSRLFGLSGWKAPFTVNRFTMEGASVPKEDLFQEFVAIDRFTGGAAESLKYNAEFARPCTLIGDIVLDHSRAIDGGIDRQALGLIALVLRDLVEGDLPVGAHSATGCGTCHAEITVHHAARSTPFADWIQQTEVTDSLTALRSSITNPVPRHV